MFRSRFAISVVILSACGLLSPERLASQSSLWVDRGEGNALALEVLKPVKSDSTVTGYTTLSGALFLSGWYQLSEHVVLVGELSLVHGAFQDASLGLGAQTKLGNPYLGAELHLPESPVFFELGFRVPITPDDPLATAAGIASDFDRAEAFIRDILPVLAAINFETVTASRILFRVRGGTALWFNAGDVQGSGDVEVQYYYSLQVGYTGRELNAIAGVTGRYAATLPNARLEDRSLQQFGGAITVPLGRVRPGVSLKIPLDSSAGRLFESVLGLNVAIDAW